MNGDCEHRPESKMWTAIQKHRWRFRNPDGDSEILTAIQKSGRRFRNPDGDLKTQTTIRNTNQVAET